MQQQLERQRQAAAAAAERQRQQEAEAAAAAALEALRTHFSFQQRGTLTVSRQVCLAPAGYLVWSRGSRRLNLQLQQRLMRFAPSSARSSHAAAAAVHPGQTAQAWRHRPGGDHSFRPLCHSPFLC